MLKSFFSTSLFALLGVSVSAFADDSIAVSKKTCSSMTSQTKPFVLVLDSGDNLLESVAQCAKDAKLKGASFSGLGQIHNPVLSYFTSNPKDKPRLKSFSGYYELASINGNVTVNGDQYYPHAHVVLANKAFQGIAGHLDHGKVGLTVEISMVPLNGNFERTVDPKTGFGPIVH